MIQRVIAEHRGCGYGCFTTLSILIVATLLIAVLPYVGAVAAGVGLYFLMRNIWRQYVQQRPDASFVQWGLKFAPITRKIMAALLCCALGASPHGRLCRKCRDERRGEECHDHKKAAGRAAEPQ